MLQFANKESLVPGVCICMDNLNHKCCTMKQSKCISVDVFKELKKVVNVAILDKLNIPQPLQHKSNKNPCKCILIYTIILNIICGCVMLLHIYKKG